MQNIINAIKIAISAILTNKTRSFLTMLGIVIGVGSVILLTSIGTGLQNYITEQFNSFGAANVYVFPGNIFGESGGFSFESQASSLTTSKFTLKEISEVLKLREFVKAAAPEVFITAKVAFGSVNKQVTVYGTNEQFFSITSWKTTAGRVFTESEDRSSARVAVLGQEIALKLFGNVDPIGKKIRIGSTAFEVVGVLEKRGSTFGGPSLDTYVVVPATQVMRLGDLSKITQITVQAVSRDKIPETVAALKEHFGKRYKSDEFSVVDQTQILQTVNQVLGALTVGLGGIAAISLVVGGIGILNIMLVSVIERTREIGLRKAIGATPNIILTQFLVEAICLSVIGGTIGTLLAFLLTLLVKRFIPAEVTPPAVMVAFGVSAAVGIVFGVLPARRASKLSPIEALRYE